MTNLLQDPWVVIYDKLFFGLTLGNYDLHISTESGLLEEFLIVREKFYPNLVSLESTLPNYMTKAYNEASYDSHSQFLKSNGIMIEFITYSDFKSNEIIGLSLRLLTKNRINLSFLGSSSENRIQKIMFLLSRGILKSSLHRIKHKSILIDLN